MARRAAAAYGGARYDLIVRDDQAVSEGWQGKRRQAQLAATMLFVAALSITEASVSATSI